MSDVDFAEVLTRMVQMGASDVHLTAGFQPAVRVRGQITALEDFPELTTQQTRGCVYAILNADQRKHFENDLQLDFAYAIPNVARFRVNCFFQRGAISAAFRHIPPHIKTLPELGRAAAPPTPPRTSRRCPSSACRPSSRTSPASRAASCSSPARPAPARRPRW